MCACNMTGNKIQLPGTPKQKNQMMTWKGVFATIFNIGIWKLSSLS